MPTIFASAPTFANDGDQLSATVETTGRLRYSIRVTIFTEDGTLLITYRRLNIGNARTYSFWAVEGMAAKLAEATGGDLDAITAELEALAARVRNGAEAPVEVSAFEAHQTAAAAVADGPDPALTPSFEAQTEGRALGAHIAGMTGWYLRAGDRVRLRRSTGSYSYGEATGRVGTVLSNHRAAVGGGEWLTSVIWDGDAYPAPGHVLAASLVSVSTPKPEAPAPEDAPADGPEPTAAEARQEAGDFIAAVESRGTGSTPWERWADRVEEIIGHDLDGDQDTDGYSLDFAHDAFERGETPEGHATGVAAAKSALRSRAAASEQETCEGLALPASVRYVEVSDLMRPDRHEQEDRARGKGAKEVCYLCGRKVDPEKAAWVSVAGGGNAVVHPDDDEAAHNANPGAYLGGFQIGPECAKKLPAGYTTASL